MNKTARVIVTYECNRKCSDCYAKNTRVIPEVKFEDLLGFDELVIAGGEPMILGQRLVEMIHRLEFNGYNGTIWICTAELNAKKWEDKAIICVVDGIDYTLYYQYTQRDLSLLKRLSGYLSKANSSHAYKRLNIDSRLKREIDWKDVGLNSWNEVRWVDCEDDEFRVPKGQELVFYDLEKEN